MKQVAVALGITVAVTVVSVYFIFFTPKPTEQINRRSIVTPRNNLSPIPQNTRLSSWTLLVTGDVIPARVVNTKMVQKNDFNWPIALIANTLQDADLTLINLEAPLIDNCPLTNEGFKFCGDARFAPSLSAAGVDVANMANNHSLNYGWEGLQETEDKLNAVGIATTGFTTQEPCLQDSYCSKLIIKRVQDIDVGFLGYNAVGQVMDRELVQQQIEAAAAEVDVLVVAVHWGKEYEREPMSDRSLAPDDPKELGDLFIQWGADVVVGNHPHWYQPFAFVQGKDGSDKIIFYALGNTVFDQEWSEETKRGYLARLHFNGTDIDRDQLEIFPIGIRDYGQAYMLDGQEAESVLEYILN